MDKSCQNDQSTRTALHERLESAKKKAEDQILRAYFASVFEMSPMVDRFATWLLAVVGATAALTVTNIKNISSILPFLNIKTGLGFLVISGLFGFLEKFLALDIQSTVAQEAKLGDILRRSSEEFYEKLTQCQEIAERESIEKYTKVDIQTALDKFAEAHPWYKRIQIRKETNPEKTLETRLRRYYRQLTYTVLEFIGFLLFILTVVLSI